MTHPLLARSALAGLGFGDGPPDRHVSMLSDHHLEELRVAVSADLREWPLWPLTFQLVMEERSRRRRARGEAGQSTTVVGMVLTAMILVMVAFAMDAWRIVTVDRDLAAAVDGAATAGANGIDEQAYRSTGAVVLDPGRAEEMAADTLFAQDHTDDLVGVSITADAARVTVVAERPVQLVLLPSRTVRAGAEATPRRSA